MQPHQGHFLLCCKNKEGENPWWLHRKEKAKASGKGQAVPSAGMSTSSPLTASGSHHRAAPSRKPSLTQTSARGRHLFSCRLSQHICSSSVPPLGYLKPPGAAVCLSAIDCTVCSLCTEESFPPLLFLTNSNSSLNTQLKAHLHMEACCVLHELLGFPHHRTSHSGLELPMEAPLPLQAKACSLLITCHGS